jgi:hypothetical protein
LRCDLIFTLGGNYFVAFLVAGCVRCVWGAGAGVRAISMGEGFEKGKIFLRNVKCSLQFMKGNLKTFVIIGLGDKESEGISITGTFIFLGKCVNSK